MDILSMGGACLVGVAACSAGGVDNRGSDVFAPPDRNGNLPGPTASATGSNAPIIIDVPGPTGSNTPPGAVASPEVCDGLDNDLDGVIDDIDKQGDGLCDCLNIGFLGEVASDAGNMTAAFQSWLESKSDVPVAPIPATMQLTQQLLAPLQVLVIGNLTARVGTPYSADELAAFRSWVTVRGGGVLTLGGFTANESHMVPTAELLAQLGLGYDYQGRGPGVLGEGAPPMVTTGIVNPAHPVMEGVSALGVYYGYPVLGEGEVLLRHGGFDLALVKQVERGRALVFADEWITQDKLWLPGALPQELQVGKFWLNAINWLAPADECKVFVPQQVR